MRVQLVQRLCESLPSVPIVTTLRAGNPATKQPLWVDPRHSLARFNPASIGFRHRPWTSLALGSSAQSHLKRLGRCLFPEPRRRLQRMESSVICPKTAAEPLISRFHSIHSNGQSCAFQRDTLAVLQAGMVRIPPVNGDRSDSEKCKG